MSLESVKAHLAAIAPDLRVEEHGTSTATVELAAAVHGVGPERIAKTLSVRVDERVLLIVVRGDSRVDNRKMRDAFGGKARMLGVEEVEMATGHPVGGVCPFGLAAPLPIYCDVSLRGFDEVIPAAGSTQASVRVDPVRMAELVGASWVDVCREAG